MLGDVTGVIALGVELMKHAAQSQYSREHETEADIEGVRMLDAAMIDPAGIMQFFEMLEEDKDTITLPIAWMSSHPQHADRVASIQQQIATFGERSYEPLAVDWRRYKLVWIQASRSCLKNRTKNLLHRKQAIMQVEISDRPSFANLRVQLGPGDRIVAEADAMASMGSDVQMTTRWNGGPINGVLRRVLGSESMFVNEFSATAPSQLVLTQAVSW